MRPQYEQFLASKLVGNFTAREAAAPTAPAVVKPLDQTGFEELSFQALGSTFQKGNGPEITECWVDAQNGRLSQKAGADFRIITASSSRLFLYLARQQVATLCSDEMKSSPWDIPGVALKAKALFSRAEDAEGAPNARQVSQIMKAACIIANQPLKFRHLPLAKESATCETRQGREFIALLRELIPYSDVPDASRLKPAKPAVN